MRIAITGASGNAGTALLRNLQGQLSRKPGSLQLVGISRRLPDTFREPYDGVQWHTLDVGLDQDRPLLAVHTTREARNGQIVVARIGDEVTVKRFKREGNKVWLLAENADFAPIEVNLKDQDLVIEGLSVGVIRR